MSGIPKYNFFISYANEDRTLAQRLHQLLAGRGFVSSFDDFDSSRKNSRNKIFKAVYDSAVCVLIIGSRKQSPWWDDQICKAIKQRVSTSHGEYRVVSILLSTPRQHLHDLSFQIDWGFQSEGRIHYSDVIDDAEKLHELIRLIRGADRQPSLLANSETREWATTRAKNALDVDWEKLYSGHQSQSESQSTRLKTTEDPKPVEQRTRFYEKAQDYLEILSAFVTRFTREHELAREIAQRTIVNYLSRREADNWQQGIKNEAAYLSQMAHNLLVDECSSQSKIKSSKSAFDAANPLLLHAWTQAEVKRSSRALTHKFGISQEDIKTCIEDKLRDQIYTVSNPKALAGWIYKVGENYCLNFLKHSRVVKRHEEFVGHTAIVGKRNSIPIAISGSSTPEEDLIEKEEAPVWEQRILDTRARVRRILTEDVIIASRWGKGQKPQDIAVEINESPATVYRKLAMMQKAVIEEIGLIETEENKGLIKEGLRELFSDSLEGIV